MRSLHIKCSTYYSYFISLWVSWKKSQRMQDALRHLHSKCREPNVFCPIHNTSCECRLSFLTTVAENFQIYNSCIKCANFESLQLLSSAQLQYAFSITRSIKDSFYVQMCTAMMYWIYTASQNVPHIRFQRLVPFLMIRGQTCFGSVHSESMQAVPSYTPWNQPLSTVRDLSTSFYYPLQSCHSFSPLPSSISFWKPRLKSTNESRK